MPPAAPTSDAARRPAFDAASRRPPRSPRECPRRPASPSGCPRGVGVGVRHDPVSFGDGFGALASTSMSKDRGRNRQSPAGCDTTPRACHVASARGSQRPSTVVTPPAACSATSVIRAASGTPAWPGPARATYSLHDCTQRAGAAPLSAGRGQRGGRRSGVREPGRAGPSRSHPPWRRASPTAPTRRC